MEHGGERVDTLDRTPRRPTEGRTGTAVFHWSGTNACKGE